MSKSRMEKYDNDISNSMSRTKRNQKIYNSTDVGELSRIKTNTNVSIISDAGKEVDINKIKSYLSSRDKQDGSQKHRISLELPEKEEVVVVRKEEKNYDINAVLEHARDVREIDYEENRYRKINNQQTQIDILKNIKIREEKTIEEDDDITGPIDELNTEEKTIVELIQNIQSNSSKKKDLFDDLMSDGDETAVLGMADDNLKEELLNMTQDLENIKLPDSDFTREINIEKEKIKNDSVDEDDELEDEEDSDEEEDEDTDGAPKIRDIDKSFYTNSMSFNKTDFEGFDDLEKSANTSSLFSKIAMVLIIILLIATVILILNFILDWGLI